MMKGKNVKVKNTQRNDGLKKKKKRQNYHETEMYKWKKTEKILIWINLMKPKPRNSIIKCVCMFVLCVSKQQQQKSILKTRDLWDLRRKIIWKTVDFLPEIMELRSGTISFKC